MAIDGPGLSYWKSTPEPLRNSARKVLAEIVNQNGMVFVERFYSVFLAHKDAADFLSNADVQLRLVNSMHNWLTQLITVDPFADLQAFNKRQTQIGEIHARLQIPNHLVLEGAGLLKTSIAEQVIARHELAGETASIVLLLSELIDYAMRLMSEAYVTDTKRQTQVDEAFRMFTLSQDLGLERERQRAALMQWSQDILFSVVGGKTDLSHSPLSNSPFGLWIRHRGALLFHNSALLETIENAIAHIDDTFLPGIENATLDKAELLGDLQANINTIQFVLADLFQMATTVENGRDPLTRTFNRRFLPSVLGREIAMAQSTRAPLSVLMIDVDHFKGINDRYGHPAGDAVLGQVAELIINSVRSSDFVFRYGGEEFLIVLIESDVAEAQRVAEGLRLRFQDQAITLPDHTTIKATMSIGVAGYTGHPDYEVLIDAADRALYKAKNNGRNQVAVAMAETPVLT